MRARTESVNAAGRIAPTTDEVGILEEFEGGCARVQRRSGEKLVLTWSEDLLGVAPDLPAHIPIMLPDDCGVSVYLVAAAAAHGGVPFSGATRTSTRERPWSCAGVARTIRRPSRPR